MDLQINVAAIKFEGVKDTKDTKDAKGKDIKGEETFLGQPIRDKKSSPFIMVLTHGGFLKLSKGSWLITYRDGTQEVWNQLQMDLNTSALKKEEKVVVENGKGVIDSVGPIPLTGNEVPERPIHLTKDEVVVENKEVSEQKIDEQWHQKELVPEYQD